MRTVMVGDVNQGFGFVRKDGTPLNIRELPRSKYALAFKCKDGSTTHKPLQLSEDGCSMIYPHPIPEFAALLQVVLTWNDGNNVLMGPVIKVVPQLIVR